jgi:polar amino acid transport system substrate-binding protein
MIGIRVVGDVAEPIGKFIADRLGVSFEPVVYPNPQKYEESFGKGRLRSDHGFWRLRKKPM